MVALLSTTPVIGENNHSKFLERVLKDFSKWTNRYSRKFTTSGCQQWVSDIWVTTSSFLPPPQQTRRQGSLSPQLPIMNYCFYLATSIYHAPPTLIQLHAAEALLQASTAGCLRLPSSTQPLTLLQWKPYTRHGTLTTLCPKHSRASSHLGEGSWGYESLPSLRSILYVEQECHVKESSCLIAAAQRFCLGTHDSSTS